MIYKIATLQGKLYGAGFGEDVSFKPGFDKVETFDNQDAFDARMAELRAA